MGACTKGLSNGSSHTMKPPIELFPERSSSTQTLLDKLTMNVSINGILTFVAIIALLASIHSLYLYQYRLRYEMTPTFNSEPIDTKSEKDEESQAPPVSECNGRVPSLVGKFVTALAAGFYIAFTWHVMFATAAEHKGPGLISLDGHLRSGIAGCAFSMFFRLPFRSKSGLSKKYQADALILTIVPYILDFYAPATNFKERVIIDRFILPALGALCFVGSLF